MKNTLKLLIILVILTGACRKSGSNGQDESTHLKTNTVAGIVVADTIIYEVVIRNTNPDDAWRAKCLEGLNHAMLIDSIFEMIYTEKTMAFNHETGEKLTPNQVKKIESEGEFSRNNIGMIQFTEVWYLNPHEKEMTKKVLSMVLGYNYYTSSGDLIGHKALFRVEM